MSEIYKHSARHLDADESTWFTNELKSIDRRIFSTLNAPLKSRQLVPTISGIDAGATSYEWREAEHFGEAKIMARGAKDFPTAEVVGRKYKVDIEPVAIGFDYNTFEIIKASKGQINLPQERPMAALKGVEKTLDRLIALGSAPHGMSGFINNASVSTAFTSTAMSAMSFAQLIQHIMDFGSFLYEQAEENFESFDVLLPLAQYNLLANEFDATNSAMFSPLQYILNNSNRINSIKPWNRLAAAGAGGDDRMIGYVNSEMVVGSIVPMEARRMQPTYQGFTYTTPIVASCGGVAVRYPKGMAYSDGI